MSCCAEQCIQYSGLDYGQAGMLYTVSAPIANACLNWSCFATACELSGSSRRPCKQGIDEHSGRCLGERHILRFGVLVTHAASQPVEHVYDCDNIVLVALHVRSTTNNCKHKRHVCYGS